MKNTDKIYYSPLKDSDVSNIHATVLDILEKVGMANPPAFFVDTALAHGCKINQAGRVCFPRSLVEDIIARIRPDFILHARNPDLSIEFSKYRSINMSGGCAPMVVDFDTGEYRDAGILDFYDIARLADKLNQFHLPCSVVVPNDIHDFYEQDLAKSYTLMSSTQKHFITSFLHKDHVKASTEMFNMVLGDKTDFRDLPFCSFGSCPTISPLIYENERCEVFLEAARQGYPLVYVIAPMAGTTAPTALAGALSQTLAESLASIILIELMVPGAPMLCSVQPFVSDLRSGVFSGGGAEQALLNAAAQQMWNYYNLPGGVNAGITDSKTLDYQAGVEKGMNTLLPGITGDGTFSLAGGFLASLMAVSLEMMVVENEVLNTLARMQRGIEVTEETLSFESIMNVANVAGNFLMDPQTLKLMKTEYYYPKLLDRKSIEEWKKCGSPEIKDQAKKQVKQILSTHYPTYINPELDQKIRERFPIRLPREAMHTVSGRW